MNSKKGNSMETYILMCVGVVLSGIGVFMLTGSVLL